MALTVDQKEANVPLEGGSVFITVTSTFDYRAAFKVKSSNMELYRTKPVYGFVEPKGQFKLEILRLRPDNINEKDKKTDKLVIEWAEVPAEEKDPAATFRAGAESGDVTILMKPQYTRVVHAELFKNLEAYK